MKVRSLCLCMLVLSAPLAQASIQLDAISCSSSLSLNDRNDVSFDCGGNLSLSRGTVSAETGDLLINAAGTLLLEDILLIASNIRLTGNAVYIADDVVFEITAGDTEASDRPSINISEGRRIELTPGSSLQLLPTPGAGINTADINWETYIIPSQPVNFTQRQNGGDVTLLTPRGEIVAGEGGISGLNSPIVIPVFQGTLDATPIPAALVTIPIPAAFSQLLFGLCALFAPALKRKKKVN